MTWLSFLQHYWWFLVSLLGALLVFLLFVQGGQTFFWRLGRNDTERNMLVNATGHKWEFTFTTLVVFGGAFFASFPLFYSTSFSGAYWVWTLILFCFVIQAVSYEYRRKPKNLVGKRTFEVFLFINGILGTILLGTAVGTFFTGSPFTVNHAAIADATSPTVSAWGNAWHGLEAVLDVRNVLLGLSVCFLARCLGLMYFVNSIDYEPIRHRARHMTILNGIPFLVFFLSFVISIFLSKGFAVNPENGAVFLQKYKYFTNMIQMPALAVMFLAGVALVLWGLIGTAFTRSVKGIWFGGFGTVLTVLSLLLDAGYNNTAYYPSTLSLDSSLTIVNSSSSLFTLEVMSVVSFLIPCVVAYIWYAWYSMDKKKITEKDYTDSIDPTEETFEY